MDDVFGSADTLNKVARIIHAFLQSHFPAMTEGEREDIEQDVKLKLWKMASGGKKIAHFKSYLWKAVYTTALDALDARLAQLGSEEMQEGRELEPCFSAHALAPDIILEKDESRQALRRAVESLPRRRRKVMELHLLGMDIRESADYLNWSEPTVRHLLYRGLDDLKSKMRCNIQSRGET